MVTEFHLSSSQSTLTSKHSRECKFCHPWCFLSTCHRTLYHSYLVFCFIINIFCHVLQHNLNEYYSAVGPMNMMIIFASMLYERRIVFISTRLHKLSACVQAANAIIYPMNWQHIFIPVLPHSLVDYLLAPMPFLIGVPTSTFKVIFYYL